MEQSSRDAHSALVAAAKGLVAPTPPARVNLSGSMFEAVMHAGAEESASVAGGNTEGASGFWSIFVLAFLAFGPIVETIFVANRIFIPFLDHAIAIHYIYALSFVTVAALAFAPILRWVSFSIVVTFVLIAARSGPVALWLLICLVTSMITYRFLINFKKFRKTWKMDLICCGLALLAATIVSSVFAKRSQEITKAREAITKGELIVTNQNMVDAFYDGNSKIYRAGGARPASYLTFRGREAFVVAAVKTSRFIVCINGYNYSIQKSFVDPLSQSATASSGIDRKHLNDKCAT